MVVVFFAGLVVAVVCIMGTFSAELSVLVLIDAVLIVGAQMVVWRKRSGSSGRSSSYRPDVFRAALSQGLVLLQPVYRCSHDDIHGEVHFTVSRLTPHHPNVVPPLPWNCWHAELELMDDPRPASP